MMWWYIIWNQVIARVVREFHALWNDLLKWWCHVTVWRCSARFWNLLRMVWIFCMKKIWLQCDVLMIVWIIFNWKWVWANGMPLDQNIIDLWSWMHLWKEMWLAPLVGEVELCMHRHMHIQALNRPWSVVWNQIFLNPRNCPYELGNFSAVVSQVGAMVQKHWTTQNIRWNMYGRLMLIHSQHMFLPKPIIPVIRFMMWNIWFRVREMTRCDFSMHLLKNIGGWHLQHWHQQMLLCYLHRVKHGVRPMKDQVYIDMMDEPHCMDGVV